jgi:hypothetical protein
LFLSYGFELYGPIRHRRSEINPESLGDADSIGRIGTEEMEDLPQLNLLRCIAWWRSNKPGQPDMRRCQAA